MRTRSNRVKRGFLALPVLLIACALAIPGAALGAEGTSGYNQTPSTPTTTPKTTPATTPATTPTTPTTGTSPSKEEKTPSTKEEPTKTTTTPATPAEKASTLPFTGFDLRWIVAAGFVLMAAGFSIVIVQRRERRGGRSR